MIKACARFFHELSNSLCLNANFKNSEEFKRKYIIISLQRGKFFALITFAINLLSFYLDLKLSQRQVDAIYIRNLAVTHVAAVVLSFVYMYLYGAFEKSERYRHSRTAQGTVLSHVFLTLAVAAFLSVNSQRYTGNMDVYIMAVLAVALVVPMYPKWVVAIYGVVHISFLWGLSCFQNDATIVRQLNSSVTVVLAIILFFTAYRYNIKNFLSEEMLKEGKSTFLKLFEINPFPLIVSRFEDGKIQYANHKAMLFYGIQRQPLETLHTLYQNESDLCVIYKMLEIDHKIDDYVVEQVTLSGQLKRVIVNYKLIDYFGEKSILSAVADIAEIKRMENALTIYASTDTLTGVLNRRVGLDLFRKRFEAAKHEGRGFAIGFFDIDDLKAVNDQFGHVEGDAFIIEVCNSIKEELKPDDMMFRYGGDEFMILFDDAQESEVHRTCQRIREKFKELNNARQKPYRMNASMGVFVYRPDMELTLEQIIQIVDKDMYRHKPNKNGGIAMER